MRVKFVAGNWKMNGSLAGNAKLLDGLVPSLRALQGVDCAVCPPYPYLAQVGQALQGSRVMLGAQDVCAFGNGAYTGAVSAAMLGDLGCSLAIVGHSERRALFGDADDVVADKFVASQQSGLMPVLCVGETLGEREAGATESVVARQLDAVLGKAGAAAVGRAVIAYEPVWAIGTGKTASPAQAQAVHAFIRGRVAKQDASAAAAVRILYGGSVKAGNAAELFAMPDIDGGLIGGASLVAEEFVAICQTAVRH
jgi:triosephosphate isomerase